MATNKESAVTNPDVEFNFDEDLDTSFYAESDEDGEEQEEKDKNEERVVRAEATQQPEQTEKAENGDSNDEPTQQSPNALGKSKKPAQTAEQNAAFARQRREAEKQEAIAKARVDAIIEVVGTNPYTNKPLNDAEDVSQYLLMKKIDDEGGDPVADFAEYAKKQRLAEAAAEKAEADRKKSLADDINDFKSKYPEVDLQEIANDTDFDAFSDGKLGKRPLAEIYGQFVQFKEKLARDAMLKAQEAAVVKKANDTASVGSLANTAEAQEDYYSFDEIKKMSVEEIEKNYDKVQKSLAKLNKK